jgi:hypothetical protein
MQKRGRDEKQMKGSPGAEAERAEDGSRWAGRFEVCIGGETVTYIDRDNSSVV